MNLCIADVMQSYREKETPVNIDHIFIHQRIYLAQQWLSVWSQYMVAIGKKELIKWMVSLICPMDPVNNKTGCIIELCMNNLLLMKLFSMGHLKWINELLSLHIAALPKVSYFYSDTTLQKAMGFCMISDLLGHLALKSFGQPSLFSRIGNSQWNLIKDICNFFYPYFEGNFSRYFFIFYRWIAWGRESGIAVLDFPIALKNNYIHSIEYRCPLTM